MPKTLVTFSILVVMSVFLVNPVTQTLLMAHIVMLTIFTTWVLVGMPRSLIFVASIVVILLSYMLAMQQLVTIGDRVFNESIKYALLIFFTCAMYHSYQFNRRILLYLSFSFPIILFLHLILSADPLIYGGRLGVAIDSASDDAMISANTLGFFINICAVTMLARKPRLALYFLPIFLILLYFTFSRGALLSVGIVALAYFIRERRTIYVIFVAVASSVVFLDINMDLITTSLRLDDATGSGRTILYQMMAEQMIANPITFLLGNGPGNVNFEIYVGKVIVSAHNGYLEMVYTFGAIGVFAVIWFLTRLSRNYWSLPLDTLLYAVLLASYALSEDLMGSHNLMPVGLMLGLILHDFRACAHQRWQTAAAGHGIHLQRAMG